MKQNYATKNNFCNEKLSGEVLCDKEVGDKERVNRRTISKELYNEGQSDENFWN